MTRVFDGEGFSRDPISGAEAAEIRHMHYEVSERWSIITAANDLVRGARALAVVLKWGGLAASTMFALGVFARTQGWLG